MKDHRHLQQFEVPYSFTKTYLALQLTCEYTHTSNKYMLAVER